MKNNAGYPEHSDYPGFLLRWLLLFGLLPMAFAVNAADYYWVGGSGNWSDLLHWATTSGGSTYHIQAPTADDNVFFDANSFTGPGQIVTINSQDAFCHTMDWRGVRFNPKLTGLPTSKFLHIYGSAYWSNSMQLDYQGIIRMVPSAGETAKLLTQGTPMSGDLYFAGDGEVLLLDDLEVNREFRIENGIASLSGKTIRSNYLVVQPVSSVQLKWNDATFFLSGNDYPNLGWHYPFMMYMEKVNSIQSLNARFVLKGSQASFFLKEHYAGPAWSLSEVSFVSNSGQGYWRNASTDTVSVISMRFGSDGYIAGNNVIDSIALSSGYSLKFESGKEQILQYLGVNGTCQRPTYLYTAKTGFPVTLKSDNPITVDYCTMLDIHALGDFRATNTTDLGNTTGWAIKGRIPQDLFWVGGTGDWSDPQHWSFTSGGPGGACVPSGVDNVFFDEKSFSASGQFVNIDAPSAQCKTMDWSKVMFKPRLSGPVNNAVTIYGSLYFSPDMSMDFKGNFRFAAKGPGQEIRSAGIVFQKDLHFTGNGSWKLLDALEINHTLRMDAGTLNTNNEDITLEHFVSVSQSARSILLGSSRIQFRHVIYRGILKLELVATNLNWQAGSSMLEFVNDNGGVYVSGKGKVTINDVLFDLQGYSKIYSGVDMRYHHLQFKNHGFILGNQHLDSLIVEGGYRYRFEAGRTYLIDYLEAKGDCDKGMTYIETNLPGEPAFWQLSKDINGVEKVYVEDIHAKGATVYAVTSGDGGNNQGWTFTQSNGRTLYWVAGSGRWNDRTHWSLQSGGPGGECIPTALDDVIFDNRSGLNSSSDRVESSLENYLHACHNFIVKDLSGRPLFLLSQIVAYGSIDVKDRLGAKSYLSTLELKGEKRDLSIRIQSPFVWTLYLRGGGRWTLLDDLSLKYFLLIHNGSFVAGNRVIHTPYFHIKKANPNTQGVVELTGCKVNLDGADNGKHYTFHINDYEVLVERTSFHIKKGKSTFLVNRDSVFHPAQIIFEDPDGYASLQIYHGANLVGKTYFYGSGEIRGSWRFDSLICSAGKSYWFQSGVTQGVNKYLSILGNNCFPIRLSSLTAGKQSIIKMDTGRLFADFIQMKDQMAVGKINFFAGSHSTDIGMSNTNWVFDQSPNNRQVGILGEDLKFCKGGNVLISGNGFNDLYKYTWSTGDTTKEITVDRGGQYWVEVEFQPGCVIYDSVLVKEVELPVVMLGKDTAICQGDSIFLDATSSLSETTYRWSDGVDTSKRWVSDSGKYKVVVDHLGCIRSDSIRLVVDTMPDPALGPDIDVCKGDTVNIHPKGMADTYLWSTGAQTRSIMVANEGRYSVLVKHGVCSARDTTMVRFHTPFVRPLKDTIVCEGTKVSIGFPKRTKDLIYLWSTRDTSPGILVDSPGVFTVSVSDSFHCAIYDTVHVTWKALPTLDENLTLDTSICGGGFYELFIPTDADSMKWLDTGLPGFKRIFEEEGTYPFTISKDGCQRPDTFNLTVIPVPVAEVMGDTLICPKYGVDVEVDYDLGALQWEDGLTDNPRHFTKAGLYRAVVDNEGCFRAIDVTLKEIKCGDFQVFVPNVFTPNGDGVNDVFKPEIPENYTVLSYHLTVWNRWGEKVFSSDIYGEEWDGNFREQPMGSGVFVWMLTITLQDEFGEWQELQDHGTVTLVR